MQTFMFWTAVTATALVAAPYAVFWGTSRQRGGETRHLVIAIGVAMTLWCIYLAFVSIGD